jgi:hypothetical protein
MNLFDNRTTKQTDAASFLRFIARLHTIFRAATSRRIASTKSKSIGERTSGIFREFQTYSKVFRNRRRKIPVRPHQRKTIGLISWATICKSDSGFAGNRLKFPPLRVF